MAMVTWTVRGILTGIMGLLACQGASAWYSSKEDNIAGIYSVGGQARWAVSWRNAGGQTMPFLTDILTGEVRLLVSDGDRYLAGSSLRPQPPMTSQFVFSNAGLQHCSIQEPDHCLFGVRHQIRESKVIFRNEEIEFGGSLYQPANRGCYPSVAIAHGSEESDRYALDPLPQILAANGIAVLTYDKRGTGVSGGDWQSAGIEDLAGDLNAAIEQVLIGERETNSRAIGLLGFSEGGWVLPRASADRPAAFMISISAGAFTKGHSYMHKVELQLREQGLMGEDLEAALAQEQAMIDKARQQSSDPEASGFAKRIAYDPAADWQKVTSPILWIGGDFDILEDVPSSADRMAQLLGESGHTDHAEITFSGTNHAIFETSSRLPSAFFQMTDVTRHPPGYHALLISWIKSRFVGQEGRLCRRP